jgi:Zn-dependent protease
MFSLFIQTLFSDPVAYLMALAAMAFGLVLHNVVQAFAASSLGDDTAKTRGFFSTEPRVHIEPTYLIWLAIFGFAIPNAIPIKSYNLRGRTGSEILVWLLGPISLILWAFVLLVVGSLMAKSGISSLDAVAQGFDYGAVRVLRLAVLFIFPVPPLDGARIARAFGNQDVNRVMDQIEGFTAGTPFGFMIVFLVLSYLGILSAVSGVIAQFLIFLLQAVGL